MKLYSSFDFTSSLGLTDLDAGVPREVDIEASARVGNRIYWLGSHSNSAGGNNRPNRSRVFATDISGTGAATTLTSVGRFDGLKSDLIAWDSSGMHGLGNNFFGLLASSAAGVIPEAPDGSGWNIEGLVFAPDDSTVYIGFRAPIVPAASRTKALLVPVTNFTTLFTANPTGGNATFGAPIQFDLNNRGIREIKKNAANEYLIVAGRASSANFFDTYTWTGNPADAPLFRSTNLININPESIVDVPVGLNSFAPFANVPVQFLSDNGDTIYYGDAILAKDLPNNAHKKFRSDVIIVGLAPSAAGVEVSGRVLSSNGFGIGHARVFITESATGQTREFRTGSFGYFRFEDVTAGSTYVLSAVAKGRVFQTRVLTVDDNIYELDLVAEQ